MASGITSKDSLFVARNPAWHNQGTVVSDALNVEEAQIKSGIGWNVVQSPLYYGDPENKNKMKNILIDSLVANIREDTKDLLGIVSPKYKVIQNSEIFAFLDNLLDQGAKFESAGSLWGGKKVWMLAKLEDYNILGDRYEDYIFAANSFDGSSGLEAGNSSIRIVCQNTLNLALKTAKRKWSMKHMGLDLKARMTEASQALSLNNNYIKALQEEAEKQSEIKISDDEFIKFCEGLFPLNDDATKRNKDNVLQLRSELQTRYMMADDISKFRNTNWGVIQAVSDMAYHANPLRLSSTFEENRLNQIFDGSKLLDKAYDLINGGKIGKKEKVMVRV